MAVTRSQDLQHWSYGHSMAASRPKIAIFIEHHSLVYPSLGVNPTFLDETYQDKSRVHSLVYIPIDFVIQACVALIHYQLYSVTEGRTDRQTDRPTI